MRRTRVLLGEATARLGAAGVATPRVDAELLLAHVLGVTRGDLILRAEVSSEAAERFEGLLARRAGREPLQHILHTAPFRHLELSVGRGVFVPRPETELLVDAVLVHLERRRGPVAVDLCAGSGALALAIADEVPSASVVAVERDPSALMWLRLNALRARVTVVDGDVADPRLLAGLWGRADVVVSNPPYVPTTTAVQAEVAADPRGSVFAGEDGLEVIPRVLALAAELLKPGGLLAIEHDDSQGETVPDLLRLDGRWQDVREHADLAGRPRYATAHRR